MLAVADTSRMLRIGEVLGRCGRGSARIGTLFLPWALTANLTQGMKAYERLFIVAPTIDDETRAGVMKRIDTAIAAADGKVDNVDEWGKRKLAYEINGLTDGDYTLIDFHADPQSIAELDRILRITDAVMRHMITARPDRD